MGSWGFILSDSYIIQMKMTGLFYVNGGSKTEVLQTPSAIEVNLGQGSRVVKLVE